MITTVRICSHNVEFNYHSKSQNAIPDDAEEQHVKELLCENYVQGELCMNKLIRGREYEFRGWWRIK